MRLTRVGIPIAVLALMAGCGPLTVSPSVPADPDASLPMPKGPLMADYDRHLATWQASGIARYAFTYSPTCFCPLTQHLIVGDGGVVRIDGVPVDGSVDPPIGAPVGVEGLFEIVRHAIDGDSTIAVYDDVTGVPISMQSDPVINGSDDELDFTVTDWTLTPPDDKVLGRISLARRDWERHPPSSYVWSIVVACDCAWDGKRFDLTVIDGNVTARSNGKRVSFETLEGLPLTASDLFTMAAGAATVADVTVEFDRQLSYPTRVEIRDHRPDAVSHEAIRVVRFRAASG